MKDIIQLVKRPSMSPGEVSVILNLRGQWGGGGGVKRGFRSSKWPKFRPYNLYGPI
jgi:hypothetical protein